MTDISLKISDMECAACVRRLGKVISAQKGVERAEINFAASTAAVSYDEGKTWPVRKLITDGQYRFMDGGAWTGFFETDADRAEPRGYLAMTQSPDGIIHLLSSKNHYRFNLKWLEQND